MDRVKFLARTRAVLLPTFGKHDVGLMLKAYLDESGHSADRRSGVVSVGGAIGSVAAWEAFEPDWIKALNDFQISELHMRGFAHGIGEFSSWSEERRRALVAHLMSIMERCALEYIGAAVILEDYWRLAPEQRSVLRDPYFTCFQLSVRCAAVTAVALSLGQEREWVEIIVADSEFSGQAMEVYRLCVKGGDYREHLGPITFARPREVVPLQVADLVSYELGRYVARGQSSPRWPMQQLQRQAPAFYYLDYPSLLALCAEIMSPSDPQ